MCCFGICSSDNSYLLFHFPCRQEALLCSERSRVKAFGLYFMPSHGVRWRSATNRAPTVEYYNLSSLMKIRLSAMHPYLWCMKYLSLGFCCLVNIAVCARREQKQIRLKEHNLSAQVCDSAKITKPSKKNKCKTNIHDCQNMPCV